LILFYHSIIPLLTIRQQHQWLLAWLTARGKAWCDGVEVACSEMWDAYQEAAAEKLPNARRVIDRFHVMKNLVEAITKARRIIQRDADDATKDLLKDCRPGRTFNAGRV